MLIPGGGGLRKVRWNRPGMGKQGGVRIIYYVIRGERLYVLDAYAKADQEDLTKDQIKELRDLIKTL